MKEQQDHVKSAQAESVRHLKQHRDNFYVVPSARQKASGLRA